MRGMHSNTGGRMTAATPRQIMPRRRRLISSSFCRMSSMLCTASAVASWTVREFLAAWDCREFLGSGDACEFLERNMVREFLVGGPPREFLVGVTRREFFTKCPPREFSDCPDGREFSEPAYLVLYARAPRPHVAQPPVIPQVLPEAHDIIIHDAVTPAGKPRYVPEVHVQDGEREVMEAGTRGDERCGAPPLEDVVIPGSLSDKTRQGLHPICILNIHTANIHIFKRIPRLYMNF